MGTITYDFDPNTTVWCIIACVDGSELIKEGKVIRVRGEVLLTGTTVEYDIQVVGVAGTIPVAPSDTDGDLIFATLNAATLAYEIRLT